MINGFGRIGRLVFRYAWEDPTLDIVAVNDLCSKESAAYLAQYDSVHGTWSRQIEECDEGFTVDGKLVKFSQAKSPTELNLDGIAMVMECTGKFLKVATLQPYLDRGIQQVVVSAPVKEAGALNVVLGCNHELLQQDTPRRLVTNASCTTNCLGPVVRVIKEHFGIVHGCITTIHDVTG